MRVSNSLKTRTKSECRLFWRGKIVRSCKSSGINAIKPPVISHSFVHRWYQILLHIRKCFSAVWSIFLIESQHFKKPCTWIQFSPHQIPLFVTQSSQAAQSKSKIAPGMIVSEFAQVRNYLLGFLCAFNTGWAYLWCRGWTTAFPIAGLALTIAFNVLCLDDRFWNITIRRDVIRVIGLQLWGVS